jgi:hypothetical protein
MDPTALSRTLLSSMALFPLGTLARAAEPAPP